jgi:ATP-binding cassette subfamily F protein 3
MLEYAAKPNRFGVFIGPVIHLTQVSKQYGSHVLYKDASFQIRPGDKIGLVGPNGAGKTTVFRLIMREEMPDSGNVSIPDKMVIGYFSQDVGEMSGRSALAEVMAGAGKVSDLAGKIAKMEQQLEQSAIHPLSDDDMTALLDKYGEAQLEFEQRGGYDLESRAKAILTGLGIGPGDYERPVETFSGGWKMRIALARILALNPDALLMDEPTNHLDLESIMWLEEWLQSFKGSLIMTSHDREFMNRIVNRIVEVANKAITVYSGNYDFYLRERQIRKDQLLAAHQKQNDMLAKEEEFIARFAARASHAAQVQSRVKKLDKIERIEIPAEDRAMKFEFPVSPRSGNDVVKMQSLAKTWVREDGTTKPVFSGATGVVKRLDKVAVVGVNGAGKSTLLRCVTGLAEASEGNVELGASVRMGYFSQHALEVLNPNKTIFEEIHDRIPDATIGFVRNLLGAFLFSGDDVEKKIGVLSGGEKSRVVLATILAKPVNFLVLDEPTNHLDIKSREILLEALRDFEGTVMIVSHDRHFLRQVANRVFEVDHGELRVYEGNYETYLSRVVAARK